MNRFYCLITLAATFLFVAIGNASADAPLELVQKIPLKGVDGKLDHLTVDAKGMRLFVANKPNNTLDIVDLKTGKLVKQIADQGKVSGVAYAADLDMVYVGNGAGVCNGFACKDYSCAFSTKMPGADNVQYHSGTKMLYVAQGETMSVLDAKTGEVKESIKLPGSSHGFRIDKKAAKIFVVMTKPATIGVVDLVKNEVTDKFSLTLSDGGSPIAYDAKDNLLFIGCPKKPMVVVFDAKTGKELTSIAIPSGVDDLHFDSKRGRLYASCADSVLAVIEKKGDVYEVIARLETPKSSRTCAFSGTVGKLYLAVPKQKDKDGPEIWVYEAKPVNEAKPKENK
jgi:DNA-binding beta-propeller fold protein YncE